jgi:hypothetical protein
MNPIEIVKELETKALAGDQAAAEALFAIAFESADSLKHVALKNHKTLLRATRVSAFFPAMIVANKSKDIEHAQLLKLCEVGKDSSLNVKSTKGMTLDDTEAKKAATAFYGEMKWMRLGNPPRIPAFSEAEIDACKRLPKPSRKNYKQWSAALNNMLPGVERIAEYPQPLRDSFKHRGPETYNIVDHMKKAILQALFTLLPD